MRSHGAVLVVSALVVAVALAACSNDTPTNARLTQAPAADGSGGASDDTIPRDLPASFRVHGRVLGVSQAAATPGSDDTLSFAPVAGAPITIYHTVLVNGVATQVVAAHTVSGTDGSYQVDGLEGGYYIVSVTAPAGSPWADGWSYLPGTSADVTVDVYLWQKS
ncbi:MAG TPA: hypothetical protein VFS05_01035 [Gemmatimonadaceae bacterium]|nr:hypothetical protein [Gemmatimonadaceae bacterium]